MSDSEKPIPKDKKGGMGPVHTAAPRKSKPDTSPPAATPRPTAPHHPGFSGGPIHKGNLPK